MANLASHLAASLSASRQDLLRSASHAAGEAAAGLYLVGGSVRDVLLGGSPADLDFSVVGGTAGFADTLAEALGGEVASRSRFGTAKLRVGESVLDVVQARRETYPHPGALPSVEPGSLEDDLARRDFSINAMAVSLSSGAWGELTDPFDGAGDLERQVVNVLHPLSFRDDATRLFRAVRYAGRLGFRLGPDTERLARGGVAFLDAVSGDRVRHELERIFLEGRAAAILGMAGRLGLLGGIHPSLRLSPEVAAGLDRVEAERGPAILAGLACSLSPGEAEEVAARLNLGGEWSRVVTDTVMVRESLEELESDVPASRVYGLLHGRHEAAVWACAAGAGPRAAANLDLYLVKLRHVSTSLSGRDVIDMGMPEGPAVGEILRDLLKARLDGAVDSTDGEREMAARRIAARG